ncbi:MAG: nitroreductase family protein [Desulfobacteraceae bacterium]|nr:nitroreductase family protein [Desulfobacteraceae bacterium]
MENRRTRKFESPGNWTPVEKTIFSRRSTRAFKKTPLPDFMIRRILEAGRFAPSSGNTQPWRFAVIKSP